MHEFRLLLNRKWNVTDLNFVSRCVIAKNTRQKVAELYNKGIRNKDIALALGISPSTVTKYTKIIKQNE